MKLTTTIDDKYSHIGYIIPLDPLDEDENLISIITGTGGTNTIDKSCCGSYDPKINDFVEILIDEDGDYLIRPIKDDNGKIEAEWRSYYKREIAWYRNTEKENTIY